MRYQVVMSITGCEVMRIPGGEIRFRGDEIIGNQMRITGGEKRC